MNPYTTPPEFRSHFWEDLRRWIPHYRCSLCKQHMKGRFPQELKCCDHVFCAGCIKTYYYTDLHNECPRCRSYINAPLHYMMINPYLSYEKEYKPINSYLY